jgi:2-methylcitrate dehydratase PrpD
MGKAGFKGHADPLGGRGFLKMMTGREDIELKPALLNGTYAIMKSYTKPYASCRYTHPPVEAAIRLRDRLRPEEIEEVDIRTYGLAVSGHEHTEIPGSYSAKMSIPYATAAGFLFGKAGMQEFLEETVRDPHVAALTRKIRVSEDPALSALFPEKQSAVMTVRMKDGSVFTQRVDYPKGEPENPLTENEFCERYDGLMAYAGIGKAESDRIYRDVQAGNPDMESLTGAL